MADNLIEYAYQPDPAADLAAVEQALNDTTNASNASRAQHIIAELDATRQARFDRDRDLVIRQAAIGAAMGTAHRPGRPI